MRLIIPIFWCFISFISFYLIGECYNEISNIQFILLLIGGIGNFFIAIVETFRSIFD
jgi:hypothetical protein